MPTLILICLLLAFISVPLLEIALLIKVGNAIGFWPTVLIVIGTAIAGMNILQRQGLVAAQRVIDALRSGETPMVAVLEGSLRLMSGVLLILPGLMSDAAGLVLLSPHARRSLARLASRRLFRHLPGGAADRAASYPPQPGETGIVIEGEFERLDERPMRSQKPDGGTAAEK